MIITCKLNFSAILLYLTCGSFSINSADFFNSFHCSLKFGKVSKDFCFDSPGTLFALIGCIDLSKTSQGPIRLQFSHTKKPASNSTKFLRYFVRFPVNLFKKYSYVPVILFMCSLQFFFLVWSAAHNAKFVEMQA